MQKVLLDTNMFIYIEDNSIIEEKVLKLTKRLFDSNDYKIVIHPDTKKEIEKIQDSKKREIFKSKIAVYKEIKSPPQADEEFNKTVGCKNSHDAIDNNLLFAVKRNCVSYLITNDHGLKKKSVIIGLEKRVLSIDEALDLFKEEFEPKIEKPPFITNDYLYNIDIDDPFFDSLKNDYKGFEEWFKKKQESESTAYITKKDKKITSMLMMKIEEENEDYSRMNQPLSPKRRLKISTMKVADTGKRIGESFIKIIMDVAIKKNVDEIYVTTFETHPYLIELFNNYGFKNATFQYTEKSDGTLEKELVLVKNARPVEEFYPFISLKNKKFFLVPIKEEFHKILFPEAERRYQMSFDDIEGTNTAANSLKKAYLCNSKITKIKPGSILLFYASELKKSVTTIGVVDMVFNKFDDFNDMYELVRKRTAYKEEQLKRGFKKDKLVILFKQYYSLPQYVSYKFLKENNIITGPIQSITEINKEEFDTILNECKVEKEKYIID